MIKGKRMGHPLGICKLLCKGKILLLSAFKGQAKIVGHTEDENQESCILPVKPVEEIVNPVGHVRIGVADTILIKNNFFIPSSPYS